MTFRVIETQKGLFPTIMYDISFGKKRLRGKTNLSVPKESTVQYNPLKLKSSNRFSQIERLEIEKKLSDFEYFVNKTKAELKGGNLNNNSLKLKEEIEIHFGRLKHQESEKLLSLFEFIPKFIERKSKERINKNGNVSKIGQGTIWAYQQVERYLKDYKADRKITLNYKDINSNFETDFSSFLREKLQSKNNTIGKHIKGIKVIIKQAHIDGHHNNLKYQNFKVLVEKVDSEYLNEVELEELFNRRSEFSKNDLPKIDYFLLMSYTALRVNDILRLRRENIIYDEIPLIDFFEKKNKIHHYIPITPNIQKILDYYNGGFPNDEIKKKVNDGERINDVLRKAIKHKKITSHCGRRSYVNNEYIKGTSIDDIMLQTKHKSKSAFMHYLKQSSCKELLKARAKRGY